LCFIIKKKKKKTISRSTIEIHNRIIGDNNKNNNSKMWVYDKINKYIYIALQKNYHYLIEIHIRNDEIKFDLDAVSFF
jgi:hypothetical protein